MNIPSERRTEPPAPGAPIQPAVPGFRMRIDSNGHAARAALARILDILQDQGLGTDEAGSVQIVLAEVLNNILEHAYRGDTANGAILVEGDWRGDGLHLSVRDSGLAMPQGRLPLGARPAVEVDLMELPEGGFGWFLINDLAKDLSYRRVGGENLLSFRLAITPPC